MSDEPDTAAQLTALRAELAELREKIERLEGAERARQELASMGLPAAHQLLLGISSAACEQRRRQELHFPFGWPPLGGPF